MVVRGRHGDGSSPAFLAVTKQFADSDACGILEDDIIL
jgi:hypothetical protein